MFPEVAGRSWKTSLPSVDLPHPDSPTSPSVSPSRISRLTPSTAFTEVPTPAGKCFTTFTTRSSASGSAGSVVVTAGRGSAIDRLAVLASGRSGQLDLDRWADAGGRPGPGVDDVRRSHLLVSPLHGHPAGG